MTKQANLILTDGGVGDLIGELSAVEWLLSNTDLFYFIWMPDYLIDFAKHVLPKNRRVIKAFSQQATFNHSLPTRSTQWTKYGITPMRIPALTYGFLLLADRLPPESVGYVKIRPEEVNISRLKLPKDYVCIAAAAAEPVKSMPIETANAVIDRAISKGLTPVFLGRESNTCGFQDFQVTAKAIPLKYDKGINLLNKTSLLESATIIAGAKCFVGMDGGLVHLAATTETPIVAGYTLVDPSYAAPKRTFGNIFIVEPDKSIVNRYYQTYSSCMSSEDCRKFIDWEKVVADMTCNKFIRALDLVLG